MSPDPYHLHSTWIHIIYTLQRTANTYIYLIVTVLLLCSSCILTHTYHSVTCYHYNVSHCHTTKFKAHTMHLSLYQGLSCWQYLCGINYVYCRCDTSTAHTWQYHDVCGLTRWPCQEVIVPTQHHGNTANDSDIHGAGWSLWLMKQSIYIRLTDVIWTNHNIF